jgi:hypothetical protein
VIKKGRERDDELRGLLMEEASKGYMCRPSTKNEFLMIGMMT